MPNPSSRGLSCLRFAAELCWAPHFQFLKVQKVVVSCRTQVSESVLSSCKTLAAHRESVAWNLTLFVANIKKNNFFNGHFRNLNWRYLPCKAYVREYPHKIWPHMVQYLHFRILKFPLTFEGLLKYQVPLLFRRFHKKTKSLRNPRNTNCPNQSAHSMAEFRDQQLWLISPAA